MYSRPDATNHKAGSIKCVTASAETGSASGSFEARVGAKKTIARQEAAVLMAGEQHDVAVREMRGLLHSAGHEPPLWITSTCSHDRDRDRHTQRNSLSIPVPV